MPVCLTCRHHLGEAEIPLFACQVHQGLIGQGEQLTAGAPTGATRRPLRGDRRQKRHEPGSQPAASHHLMHLVAEGWPRHVGVSANLVGPLQPGTNDHKPPMGPNRRVVR